MESALEIISWVLRAIGFLMIAVFVLPKLSEQFKKDENGVRVDRYSLVVVLNGTLLWSMVGVGMKMGWFAPEWAMIISGFGFFSVAAGFFIIAYRYEIRDVIHRWFH